MTASTSTPNGLELDARRGLRANGVLAVALLACLALAPVPAAGNRPVFWALTGAVVGLLGAAYAATLLIRRAPPHPLIRRLPLVAALWTAAVIWLLVQTLPLRELVSQVGLGALWGSIASPAISVAPGATALSALQLGTYALFFYLFAQAATNRGRVLWLAPAVLYVVTAHAAYALIALTQLGDPMLIVEKWAYEGMATGTFVNRNSFATFLAIGLMVGLALLLRELDAYWRHRSASPQVAAPASLASMLTIAVCMLTLVAALLASQSRLGVFSAALGGLAVVAGYAMRRSVSGARPLRRIVLLLVAGGAVALTLYGGGLFERLGSLDASADVRSALYAQVLQMIGDRPWLGFGGGTFEVAFPFFHRLPVSADLTWDKAHSTYLALWAEFGVVAGSLPMLVVVLAGLRLLPVATRRDRDWSSALAGLGAIVVAAVHSVADFSLEIQANALLFTAILALGLAGAKGGDG